MATAKIVSRIPDRFRAALNKNPHCRTLRLAIVDALLEDGDEVGAAGMKLLVDRLEVASNERGSFVVEVSKFCPETLDVDWWGRVPPREDGDRTSDTFDRLLRGWCRLTEDERDQIKEYNR